MAAVILKNVKKSFPGGVQAVKDISLDIKDGEFVVIVGPSGCGKSTTLRLIAGLEEITAGEIYIGGRLVNNVLPKDRDIAMVFQNYALYPHMSVRENMEFGLRLRKYPVEEIAKRISDAADILGIGDLLDRRPKELSGGQRQRVAVGRAIVRKPAVFLFDEPLSNLDAKLRVQMRVELSRLHTELKTTMIYVTHDQVEAVTLGDRIVVMKDGVVQQVAGPLEIYDKPANRFVAGFIGSPPMNIIAGSVVKAANGATVFACGVLQADAPGVPSGAISLGVRPEDISVRPVDGADSAEFIVDAVEPVGAESYLYLRSGDLRIVSRCDRSAAIQQGTKVAITLSQHKLHFFDGQTGERIICPSV